MTQQQNNAQAYLAAKMALVATPTPILKMKPIQDLQNPCKHQIKVKILEICTQTAQLKADAHNFANNANRLKLALPTGNTS